MKMLWALPLFFAISAAHALNGLAKPEWKNGDDVCPVASNTDRYIDVPVFYDLEAMAHVGQIPGLNVFKDDQATYKNKQLRVYYELFRPWDPAKKLMIIVPGGPGQTHADLHPLVDLYEATSDLLKQYNVIAMDHRGVGCSRPLFPGNEPPESMMMRQAASDIESIRQALIGPQGKMSVWGYSYGSILSQTYALLYPDHMDRLFLGGVASDAGQWHLAGLQFEEIALSGVPVTTRNQFAELTQNAPEIKEAFLRWTMSRLYTYQSRILEIPARLQKIIAMLNGGRKADILTDLADAPDVLPWMMRSISCMELFPFDTIYPGEFPIWQLGFGSCSEFQGKFEYFNYTPLLKQIQVPTLVYAGSFDHVTSRHRKTPFWWRSRFRVAFCLLISIWAMV